jgi:hypothetical protein
MDGKHIDWGAGSGEVKDASGNSNDGTLNGGMSNELSAAKGRVGQALDFDGSDDYIGIDDNSSLDITTEITESAWVKPNNCDESHATVATKNLSYYFQVHSDCKVAVYTYWNNSGSRGGSNYDYSNEALPTGKWSHIVFTEASDGTRKIYINGQLDSTHSAESSIWEDNNQLRVGAQGASNRRFDGEIDDVRIYDRALTDDEINRIYNATRPSGVNTPQTDKLTDGLVGFWSFDGSDVDLSDSTAEVKDVSGKNNDGDAKKGAKPAIGKLGQGYEFDGSDDYVEILTPSGLSSSDSFTVTAWVDGASQSDNTRIVNYGNTSANQGGFILGQTSSGKIRAYTDAGGGSWNQITGNTSFDDGNWHLIVMTYNGSTDTRQLYLDGEKDGSETHGYDNSPSNPGISLGNRLDSQSEGQKGVVDNVRIYDRALSASEIDKLYQLGN